MIGVCIKYFHENYGGMLQSYATVKMLEEHNIEYELIRYEKKKSLAFVIKSLPRLLNSVLRNDKIEAAKKQKGLRAHKEFAENDAVRMDAFAKFKDKAFTNLSEVYYGYDKLCEGAKKYSAVITGSDQLWSPAGLPTNYYNLMFVPDDIRKISYASSFGVSNIPWYQKRRTINYLNRIEYISMRENRGSEIVKELTGRSVPTLLDPVFMFDKEGWERLVPTQKEFDEPYIFSYFLGDNPRYRKEVQQAAKKLGCKIVVLRHLDQYIDSDESFGDYAPYDVAPDRFLNLIRGAEFVCTDSFHGSVFSIIHHKPFVTFDRYSEGAKHSKNSRIDTLCANLGLQNRRYNSGTSLSEVLEQKIKYDEVDKKLSALRAEADLYIKTALDGAE